MILLNMPSPSPAMVNVVYKTVPREVEKIVEELGIFQSRERFEGTSQKEIMKALAEMPEDGYWIKDFLLGRSSP